ncbi:MAG TPA: MoaD/ThiS family protein [Anaerovoracaceae bacterium]|nr:MoaD/ThiS family protein [Anaerovoracaceae bacterium]
MSLPYIKGMTVKNVLENIANQYPDLGAYFKPSESRRNVLVTIKGKTVLWESKIAENDEATLLSICGGG